MKKFLYSALMLAAAAFVGCSEENNGASAGDTKPVVTIYSIATSADADPDTSVALRLAPNALTTEMFVLPELVADKEAYVAEFGPEAHIAYVMDNGEIYTDERVDLQLTGLAGKYVITIVAANENGQAEAYEYFYEGILWQPYDTGFLMSGFMASMFQQTGTFNAPIKIEKADGRNLYRIKNPYVEILNAQGLGQYGQEGCHFIFEWDGESAQYVPQGRVQSNSTILVDTGFLHPNYGMCWLVVDPDPDWSYYDPEYMMYGSVPTKVLVVNAQLACGAGTFYDWADEFFVLEDQLPEKPAAPEPDPDAEPANIAAMLFTFSEVLPNYSAQYPDHTSLAGIVMGEDIVAGGAVLLKGDMGASQMVAGQAVKNVVDQLCQANGLTEDELFEAFGDDYFADINSEYGCALAYARLNPATAYTLLVKGLNSKGGVQYTAHTHATAAAPNAVPATGSYVRKGELQLVKDLKAVKMVR